MNLEFPLWCIPHKTMSYISAPRIPTDFPGGDAIPLFSTKAKAAAFKADLPSDRDEYETEGIPLEHFGSFLKSISGLGVQYVAINPVIGKRCRDFYKVGVMLAQWPSDSE